MAKYLCSVCGYIYDEAKEPIPWDQLPANWTCPLCGSDKSYFQLMEEKPEALSPQSPASPPAPVSVNQKRVCSVCGYIIHAGHDTAVCPACGFPQSVFKPFKDTISPSRRKILDLHLHQIIVHFPQAFALFIFFLLGVSFVMPLWWEGFFLMTAKVLAFFLPFSVVAALITGILDGQTRFKRINTPVLQSKLLVALLFLGASVGLFYSLVQSSYSGSWRLIGMAFAGICAGAATFLGHNGGRLAGNVVPDQDTRPQA